MLDFNKPAAEAPYIRFRTTSTYEEKHGRKETRDYAVSDDIRWLVKKFPQWKSVKSIGVVESTRDAGEGLRSPKKRFFRVAIGSHDQPAQPETASSGRSCLCQPGYV
jgi:hypothetical protein